MLTLKASPFAKLLAFPGIKRVWEFLLMLHSTLGTSGMIALAVVGFYALYVVKVKLGIDIFPGWGLHLPGPRTLFRQILRSFEPE